MAVAFVGRTLLSKSSLSSIFSRSLSSTSLSANHLTVSYRSSLPLLRLRPLVALSEFRHLSPAVGLRCYSSRPATSSLNDRNPNWSNRPPKETILLDGCDFEHWLIVMEKPEGDPTRDEIIDSYIKTLAAVVGSEEEARMKIYSVSTRHYFAFGALVSEELSYKIKELPRVRWVLPDSYLDVKNKDYGGEPFINGQAVPYDPKYHEEWVRNNARANERNRRNDRPRNFDRSRNFERRRENMQNREFQNREMPPMRGPDMPNNMGGMPPNRDMQNPMPNNMGGMPPNRDMQNPMPNNMGGMPPNRDMPNPMANNMGGMPPNRDMQNPMANNMGGMLPNRDMQNPMANNMGGMPPNRDMQNPMPNNMGGMPPSNMGGMPPNNAGGFPQNNMGGMPPSPRMQNPMPNRAPGPNAGYPNSMPYGSSGNLPNRDFQSRDTPNSGSMPYQNREPGREHYPNSYTPNSYAPNRDIGGQPSGDVYQVRDVPGRDMP